MHSFVLYSSIQCLTNHLVDRPTQKANQARRTPSSFTPTMVTRASERVARVKGNAATKIAFFWRRQKMWTLSAIIRRFVGEGMLGLVKTIPFEEQVVLLRKKSVVGKTKSLMLRIQTICSLLSDYRGQEGDSPVVNVRVVLAAWMIVYKSREVFEEFNDVVNELIEAAKKLLQCLEQIIYGYSTDNAFCRVSADAANAFIPLLFDYLKKFKVWKVPDEQKLTLRIKHALFALHGAQDVLPEDESVESPLRVELVAQIKRLSDKLVQIAGPGKLREFETERANGRISGSMSVACALRLRIPEGWPTHDPNARTSNEELAHQLLLDPTFQLPDVAEMRSAISQQIHAGFVDSFWKSLVDDQTLEPACYVRVIRVLQEVIGGVREAWGTGTFVFSGRVSVPTESDMQHFKRRLDTNAIEMPEVMEVITGIFNAVRAIQVFNRVTPMDANWRALKGSLEASSDRHSRVVAFTEILKGLLHWVNVHRIDAANARLRLVSPVIRDNGIDYEQGKYNARLAGGLNERNTVAYVIGGIVKAVAANLTDVDSLRSGSPAAFEKVAVTAFIDCILNVRDRDIPETLVFDAFEMPKIEDGFKCMARLTAMFTGFASSVKLHIMGQKKPSDNAAEYLEECNKTVDGALKFISEKMINTESIEIDKVIFFFF